MYPAAPVTSMSIVYPLVNNNYRMKYIYFIDKIYNISSIM